MTSIKKDFHIGSEDTTDVLFVGQRICWKTEGSKSFIQVDQEMCIEELGEIEFDKGLPDTDYCPAALHSRYQGVLDQINWLQSRTQYQACYRFSRCASASANPTTADVRALTKLVRSIRAEPCVLRYWPLKGSFRLVGYPEATYRNNVDNSSQRGQAIFLAEGRTTSKDGFGSVVDFESHKNNRVVLSTTLSELYVFTQRLGPFQFLNCLWMDISAACVAIHMRTDATNLVTTAATKRLPAQKETIHTIQMLRKEACAGQIEDRAHVASDDCLSDCLTKSSSCWIIPRRSFGQSTPSSAPWPCQDVTCPIRCSS